MTEADDLSRIRHALCIALDVNPALNEPTYDLLLRLLSRRGAPADEDWKARAERLSDDVQRLMQEANAAEPRMIELTMQNRRMAALLRQAEWAGADGTPVCPWCEMVQAQGHLPTCPVVPVLYPKERA